MTRKTLALAAMVAGLLGILFTGLNDPGSGSATHLGLGAHLSDPQVFLVDQLTCRGGTNGLTGTEDATTFPSIGPCAGETTTTSAVTDNRQDTVIHKGNRLSLGVGWSDNSFGVTADTAACPTPPCGAGVADGTVVGSVLSAINIACDDTVDYFVDNTSTLPLEGGFADSGTVPEQFAERTTTYTATSGFGGQSELFLNDILPNTTVFTKHVRYRADVNFVTLGTSFAVPLVNPVSLNAATVNATFGDARASLTLLGGDASAPSAQLVLCLESPQTSRAIISGSAAGISNPASPGLYAGWTSYISAAGIRDEQKQAAGYITNCKQIGGSFTDGDNDCLETPGDTNDANADQDGDGLIDGVDATYLGSAACPSGGLSPVNTADCDGDGRTDFEEMMNTAASLTSPREADTDGDTFADAGIVFDCDGNGSPDFLATSTSAGAGTGRNRVMYNVAYCKPTGGPSTNTSGLGGRPVGNPGAANEDNCPGIANGSQLNSSAIDTEKNANPADGTNGRFTGLADPTHFDAKFTGDACDGDADNDGIPDPVEPAYFFDPSGGTGGTGSGYCNINRDSAGNPEGTDTDEIAIVTNAADRDTDGDGSIDGVECQLAKNPADGTSKPGTTLTPEQTSYYRLQGITQPGGPAALTEAQTQDGSTIGNVPEVRGGGAGAGSSMDIDRDGCPDESELADTDNLSVGNSDRLGIARAFLGVSTFAPPGSAQADLEERRTADLDFNGVIGSPDQLGAARIALTAALPAIPDYNLNCAAGTIGYNAN